ncbi:hypothetical protein [Dactylosporangium sp. CA-092794]|uniref:hypothetical protein n=1 Tax=Dactylosporangium sp. CA-092794 TaxID=3239929 RepID=UPI003D9116DB
MTESRTDKSIAAKRDLPSPYNQDLSKVLCSLDRSTEQGLIDAANSRGTASLLYAGMTLIQNELGPQARRREAVPGQRDSVERRALDFLSQRAVVAQTGRNTAPFDRGCTERALRSRWKNQSHYIADLLRFGLWQEQYGIDYELMRIEREKLLMDHGRDLVEAVHLAAVWELDMLVRMPIFRLHLLAISTAEGDEVIRTAIGENYRGLLAEWKGTYERSFTARGLRPRPGASFAKLADMLAAMAEGMAMRELGDAYSPVQTSEHSTLLGEGGIWLLLGCLQRDDDPDRRTAEERLRAMIGSPRNSVESD